jgi:hypothetical protein
LGIGVIARIVTAPGRMSYPANGLGHSRLHLLCSVDRSVWFSPTLAKSVHIRNIGAVFKIQRGSALPFNYLIQHQWRHRSSFSCHTAMRSSYKSVIYLQLSTIQTYSSCIDHIDEAVYVILQQWHSINVGLHDFFGTSHQNQVDDLEWCTFEINFCLITSAA